MKNLAIVGLLVVILVLLYTRRLSFMDSTCQPGFELISGMCWGACPAGQKPFGTMCQKKDPVWNLWMPAGTRPLAPTNEIAKVAVKTAEQGQVNVAYKTAEQKCSQVQGPCPSGTTTSGNMCWDFRVFPMKTFARPMITSCADDQAATKTAEKKCSQVQGPCPTGTSTVGNMCWNFNTFPMKQTPRPMITTCA